MIEYVLKKYCLIAFLIVNTISFANSQSKDREELPLKRMMVTEWSGKSAGLGANNITNVLQSHSGYLWLTTYNGIQRFDGFKTITFDQEQMPFLRSSGFRTIYHSPIDHTLYFSSQSSGLIQYRDEAGFEQLKAKNGELPASIQNVLIDQQGDMWIGSVNEGLFVFSEDSVYKFQHEILGNSSVLALFQSSNNDLFVGTEGDGLFMIRDHKVEAHYSIESGLESNVINVVTEVGDSIVVGSQSGINYIFEDKLGTFPFMDEESVNVIYHSDHFLLIGSDNGLGRINLSSSHTEFMSSSGFIDMTRINDITRDSEGSYWLATGRNGLVQLKETGIINFNRFDGLVNDNVNIVTERRNGDGFFLGCDDGNIFTLESNQVKPFKLLSDVKPTGIRDIYEQSDGTVWVASYKGLIRKRGDDERVYGLSDGLPSLDLRRILEDRQGDMWIASRSGGLIKMQDEEVVEVYDRNNGLKSDFILCIEEDHEGALYFGTHSGGVAIMDSGEITNTITFTDNDQGILVFNIHVDSPAVFWAVTTAGIFYVKEGVVQLMDFDRNYTGLSMFDLLKDNNGDTWISTNMGMIYIEREELNQFLKQPNYRVNTRLITESDGMYDEICTGAVRSLKSEEGGLLIPTLSGVSVISPDKMNVNRSLPKVYVENLETQDSSYENQPNIKLSSKINRYKFNYSALSFLAPDVTRFKYKLEGFDSKFTEALRIRSAEYTNLPPGEYTFLLFATNNHGFWTKQPAKFHFVVQPALHETGWFYVLMVLLALFLVYAIYAWRVSGIQKMNKKLMKVNSELDGFVYSASHDLRSPLASLLGLINLTRKDPQNSLDYLGKMEKSVRRLDDFIGEIIDFSSNERKEVVCVELDFESIIHGIVDELSFLDSEGIVRKEVTINQKGVFISDRRRIAVIFRNLISNALKYYDDSKDESFVKIEVECNSEVAKILIEDNGIGIAKNDHEEVFRMFYRATERSNGSGLGLYIVKETVEKLEGSVQMKSERYKGTRFYIEVPFLNT